MSDPLSRSERRSNGEMGNKAKIELKDFRHFLQDYINSAFVDEILNIFNNVQEDVHR